MVPVVYAHSVAPHLEKLQSSAARDQGQGMPGKGGGRGAHGHRDGRGGVEGCVEKEEEALVALHVIQGCCLVDSHSKTLALRTSLCQVQPAEKLCFVTEVDAQAVPLNTGTI